MPLEINEIIIRANVDNPNTPATTQSSAQETGTSPNEEVIKECLKQVMEIMNEKRDR